MAERIGFEPTVGCPTPDFEPSVTVMCFWLRCRCVPLAIGDGVGGRSLAGLANRWVVQHRQNHDGFVIRRGFVGRRDGQT